MQFGAAFHQKQAKPGAWTRSYVAPAMKGFEQSLLICLRNVNSAVTNQAHCVSAIALYRKMHGCCRLRVFHGVAQEICKNMAEQPFIRLGLGWKGVQRQFDEAPTVCCRLNFVHHAPAKVVQVEFAENREAIPLRIG